MFQGQHVGRGKKTSAPSNPDALQAELFLRECPEEVRQHTGGNCSPLTGTLGGGGCWVTCPRCCCCRNHVLLKELVRVLSRTPRRITAPSKESWVLRCGKSLSAFQVMSHSPSLTLPLCLHQPAILCGQPGQVPHEGDRARGDEQHAAVRLHAPAVRAGLPQSDNAITSSWTRRQVEEAQLGSLQRPPTLLKDPVMSQSVTLSRGPLAGSLQGWE